MKPTRSQAALLRAVYEFHDARHYPPTIKELTTLVGHTSHGTVFATLEKCRERGWITKSVRTARSYVVTPTGYVAMKEALK